MVLSVALLVPAGARAHEAIDGCREQLALAEFEAAVTCLDQAEARNDLSRRDVIELLSLRAFARFASLQDVGGSVGADLQRLAALTREHTFAPEVPSSVVEAYQALATAAVPLEIQVSAERSGDQVRVQAEGRGPDGLIDSVRVYARATDGEWVDGERRVTLAAGGTAVEYYAEMVGIGGAVLARSGSRRAPLHLAADTAPEAPLASASDDTALHWGIALGSGGALVVLGVVIAILAGGGGALTDQTRVTGPMLSW